VRGRERKGEVCVMAVGRIDVPARTHYQLSEYCREMRAANYLSLTYYGR